MSQGVSLTNKFIEQPILQLRDKPLQPNSIQLTGTIQNRSIKTHRFSLDTISISNMALTTITQLGVLFLHWQELALKISLTMLSIFVIPVDFIYRLVKGAISTGLKNEMKNMLVNRMFKHTFATILAIFNTIKLVANNFDSSNTLSDQDRFYNGISELPIEKAGTERNAIIGMLAMLVKDDTTIMRNGKTIKAYRLSDSTTLSLDAKNPGLALSQMAVLATDILSLQKAVDEANAQRNASGTAIASPKTHYEEVEPINLDAVAIKSTCPHELLKGVYAAVMQKAEPRQQEAM